MICRGELLDLWLHGRSSPYSHQLRRWLLELCYWCHILEDLPRYSSNLLTFQWHETMQHDLPSEDEVWFSTSPVVLWCSELRKWRRRWRKSLLGFWYHPPCHICLLFCRKYHTRAFCWGPHFGCLYLQPKWSTQMKWLGLLCFRYISFLCSLQCVV